MDSLRPHRTCSKSTVDWDRDGAVTGPAAAALRLSQSGVGVTGRLRVSHGTEHNPGDSDLPIRDWLPSARDIFPSTMKKLMKVFES